MCKIKLDDDYKAFLIVYSGLNLILIITGIILVSLPNYGIMIAIYPFIISAILILMFPAIILIDLCLDRCEKN
jgi:hypothetical protein